jgi:hypothetical protein
MRWRGRAWRGSSSWLSVAVMTFDRAIGHPLRQAAIKRHQLEPDLLGVLVDRSEQRWVRGDARDAGSM